jgi:tetratricopeptide (TPR) repeat protein
VLVASVVATWRQATVWQTSTSLFEHAYAIAPESPAVLTTLGVLRAQAAERERDPARALALLRDADGLHQRAFALDDDPRSLLNRSHVRTLMSLRDPQTKQRHLLEAADFSRRALELAQARNLATPEYALTHGTDLVNVGRVDDGIAHLRWYVEVEPEQLRGLVNLGGALTMAGNGGEALPLLERACRLEPNDPRAWIGLARAQQAIGQRDAALASWRRALALAPGDAMVAQQIRALEAAR